MTVEQQPPSKNNKQPQRTIQVKIGNQAARAMTPDQAADYLKSIAGKGWGAGRELKMTFDNGSTSTVALPRSSTDGGSSANNPMLLNTNNNSSSQAARSSSGMPCSEKEMKALMSMFVEIMGLQMNTERLNATKAAKKKKHNNKTLFEFPQDVPPPPGGWPEDLLWPSTATTSSDGDDDDADSIPTLEEIPEKDRETMIQYCLENILPSKVVQPLEPFPPVPGSKPAVKNNNGSEITGLAGIVPFEWGALERAAIEDALEQEERIRKDTEVKDPPIIPPSKKQSSTAPASTSTATSSSKKSAQATAQEAAAAYQKVEAANKKLMKAVAAWRNRVGAAVNSGDTENLALLLRQSPLPTIKHETLVRKPDLEFLVPLTVASRNNNKQHGPEAREMLARYLLQEVSPTALFCVGRNGRSAIHTACLDHDVRILTLVQEFSSQQELWLKPCQDSGWTPLHYAAVSGSMRTVEVILQQAGGMDAVGSLTNHTHTWQKSNNKKGVTAAQLVKALVDRKSHKQIETHGMALSEAVEQMDKSWLYEQQSIAISKRLSTLQETEHYVALHEKEMARDERELLRQEEARKEPDTKWIDQYEEQESKAAKKKAKKKKKKKNKAADESISEKDASVTKSANDESLQPSSTQQSTISQPKKAEDPMVTALVGMGFEYDQILKGVEACGGEARATADDVVAWIFGGVTEEVPVRQEEPTIQVQVPFKQQQKATKDQLLRKEDERLAAEKLATKREEQRRRNREWNNRAQARQNQEAQEKVARARRGMQGPSPTVEQKKTAPQPRLVGGLNLGPSAAELDHAHSNDATDASSVDHGMIEVGGNDDATVSTMGSFPAVAAPAPSFAPPGFNGSEQWGDNQRSMSAGDAYNTGGPFAPSGGMGPPPGIPESEPLQQVHSMHSHAPYTAGIAPQQDRFVSGDPFAAAQGYGASPGTSLLGGGSALNINRLADSAGLGSSLLPSFSASMPAARPVAAAMERAKTAPSTSLGDSGVAGLMGFGTGASDLNPQAAPLDSAIIDSISTGNAALGGSVGGSSLWGDTGASAAPGGPSLLGSLINNSSKAVSESSLFGGVPTSASFHSTEQGSWNQQQRQQQKQRSDNQAGGSIW